MPKNKFTPRGCHVPADLRPWSTRWPYYTPVDITPPQLTRKGLPESVAEGWAEPAVTPEDVRDWPGRAASALVPFTFDAYRWPLNPTGRTGKTGRNLGRWGENRAADPIVVAGDLDRDGERWVLLILRGDTRQWAIPGGMVNPGETAPAALVRELREETGVDLAGQTPTIVACAYVDDPRNSDHAWIVSTAALYRLPHTVLAVGGDDAVEAAWFPFSDLDALTSAVADAGGQLYPAHLPLFTAALDHLDGCC
ncbi:NUDIX hydrolase [Lentzea guizhouensis]|uniref:NUDIX hydrolase n=1 Tax=Lentzea guizhouensis TaxID=1586287 RepID=A0A1B2HGP3_9PSEU|nr:NUDIX domain-containing protein [Lentzea guizhouensis]ANZ36874.1 NUDIX hydrolase [Lentzea guizhouensis]